MTTALFYGCFDPVTNGHAWIVARSLALDLFDHIVVGVENDPARTTLFTVQERLKLWHECARMIHPERIEVVAIDDEAPARAARRLGCQFLLRGIRSAQEYEAEVVLQRANHELEPRVQTVVIMSDSEVASISGSVVRQMIGTPGWKEQVKRYVSVPVWESLVGRFRRSGS